MNLRQPSVAIGHNEHVAWGFTIVGTDQADLYVEDDQPGRLTEYRVGNRWEKMKVVREKVDGALTVETAGWSSDLQLTQHGPVIHEDVKRHRAYAADVRSCGRCSCNRWRSAMA